MNSNEFLLDSGFWGFLYKILTPVEWLQTWIMKIVHDFFVMLGVSPIGVIVLIQFHGFTTHGFLGSLIRLTFVLVLNTLSAIPYIANGKRDALGAFDVATAKQFTQTDVFGIVSVTDNFTSAAASGKAVIGIFVFLMCFCLWFMQYFSMKRNMAAASMNKQTETMQKAMLWLFPVMYIFSGVAMPFAVLVYWLTNNV